MRELDWSVARDVVGLEVAVVVEESAKVLYRVRIRLGIANLLN
jgi:hypothetical protein